MSIVVNNPSLNNSNFNYIINGDFKIAQLATTASITAGNAVPTASLGYPVLDCWFAYSIGANSTLSQFAENTLSPDRLQLQSNAGTSSVGVGQRIESLDAVNLASKTVTLSFEASHNNLSALTITANRPTTFPDTFGTIASPTKTQIATTTVSVSHSLTRYTWTFSCPQEVGRGLEILFTFGANASAGTFQLANVKLEESSFATTFIPTIYGEELTRCQRYFCRIPENRYGYPSPNATYAGYQHYTFPVIMRIPPAVSRSFTNVNNVSSHNTYLITNYSISDIIYSAGQTNTIWLFSANCFAYIP